MANPSVKGTPNTSTTTTVTIPTHAVGDLIVIFAFRDGSTTVPSKPSAGGTVPTWTNIESSAGANTCSLRIAYCVATATNHTSGTWTNATGMIAVVVQNQASSPIGGHAQGGGTSSTLATAPSITQQQTTGKALILEFYGHRRVTAWSTAPSGYTRQASNATEVCLNSKDSSTTDGSISQNCTTSGSSGYRAVTLEILGTETSPTVSLSSPSDGATVSDTTPDLVFTGTDSESDDVRYNVQIYQPIVSDNFNRTNENPIGGNWTNDALAEGSNNQLQIVSNQLKAVTAATSCEAYWNANTFSGDIEQYFTVVTKPGNTQRFEMGFIKEPGTATYDGYVCYLNDNSGTDTIHIDRIDNASSTQLATVNIEYNAGDVISFRKNSAGVFSAYINGVEVLTTSADTTYTGAFYSYVGIRDTTGVIDEWGVRQILHDKISGTDAGFSGSPDNSDPFTSGQSVTYTVQSALADGTYYWRVRGLDPSGSNAYGAWSSVRTFVLTSATTTTQTITGKARIEKATTRTTTGKARVQKSTTQTVTGKSRITKVVSQTLQGLARITTTTLRTLTGKAAILNTTTRTTTGKARIQKAATQTIQGVARVTKTALKTITGLARITSTTIHTLTGVARIEKATSQTVQGVARVQKSTTQTTTGKARVEKTTTQTLQGKSRVEKVVSRTITGVANIESAEVTTTQDIIGVARIGIVTSRTTSGKARITATATKTIAGLARVTATTLRTITGLARVTVSTLRTISGVARIEKAATRTIQGLARITIQTVRTVTGKARITAQASKTIQGLARVTAPATRTLTGLARVMVATLRTIAGKARIEKAATQIISGLARIMATSSKLITGLARITASTSRTIAGKARLQTSRTQDIVGKAAILLTRSQTIGGTARIIHGPWYTGNIVGWYSDNPQAWANPEAVDWQSSNSVSWYVVNGIDWHGSALE